jgi:predicted MFS family arabinose efflux permease
MTDHLEIEEHASTTASGSLARLYWLALGTFAIGTEGFMIAPLLPEMARDLSVSLAGAGQLVTVFALTYALSSPVLTALTGSVDRRRLLIASMLAFAAANFVAWMAHDYRGLMTARILLAIAAGLYMPNASALAGIVVGPAHRGRALAIVTGGSSLAVALCVPIGTLVGNHLGWRVNFAIVGVMSLIAAVGLMSRLPRDMATRLRVASLRERLDVARQPSVLLVLLCTMLWAMGAFTVYTYLTSYLAISTGMTGVAISAVLFAWGVAAVVGLQLGGRMSDRVGPLPVIATSLLVLALAFAILSTTPVLLPPAAAIPSILFAIILWGVSAWAFFPAQQARLIGIAGTTVAPVALSLNASFQYLGFSIGAALGSLTVANISPLAIGWVGAGCVLASLSLVRITRRRIADVAPVAL